MQGRETNLAPAAARMAFRAANARHTRGAALLCLLLLFASGCALFDPHRPRPLRWEPPTVYQDRLENGLTVYTIENPATPLVTLDVWVNAGAKDEPPELAGISHFLEHMLFKGTPSMAPGEYDRRIEALGGYLNAATSYDYTHYYVIVPSENFMPAARDLADVIQNSVIDPAETERERMVILEEIRMKEDQPTGYAFDRIARAAFVDSPYKGTVIGSSETVGTMTRDQIREHFERYYTPDNIAVCIVGDVRRDQVVEAMQQVFGGFDRRLDPWRDSPPPTEFAPPRNETWSKDWQQTYFFFSYPFPNVQTTRERAAVDIASAILAEGRTSRLVNSITEKQRLATSIGAYLPTHRHDAFALIYGSCAPDKVDAVESATQAEIDRLANRGIRGEEMARARRKIAADEIFRAETNTGQANVLGYSHILTGGPELLTEYLEAVDQVTTRDVQDVIRQLDAGKQSRFVATPKAPGRP